MAPVLSVVIPSWNTRDLLRRCLETLFAADLPEAEVIVVDNASHDGSADMVAAEFPQVDLVRNDENEGFAIGCNQGMRRATGGYVFLLNADTELAPDAVATLLAWLEAHPEYGAAAPRLVSTDGSTQRCCQAFPGWWTPLFFMTPLERWFPDSPELRRYFVRDWDHEDSRDVDQPPAAALLVRRSVLDEVGLFDERLWLFYNDVDLSRRMADAGHLTRYVHEAEVLHHIGASTWQFEGFVTMIQANRLTYYRKHHGRLAGWWIKACVTLAWLDFVAIQLARRLRGRASEPLAPWTKNYREFLSS